jgi:hypothetical protein
LLLRNHPSAKQSADSWNAPFTHATDTMNGNLLPLVALLMFEVL